MKLDLSNTEIIKFQNLSISAGVTTTLLGNFKPGSPNLRQHIRTLQDLTNTNCYTQLIPEHKTKIPRFITTNHANKSTTGDAIIYGNKKIGYLCLIHCSWITLSENILYHAFEQLDRIGFWHYGHELNIFIYPGICKTCYEVGDAVTDELLSGNIYSHPHFQFLEKGRWLFDIAAYIKHGIMNMTVCKRLMTIPTCSAHSRFEDTNSKIDYEGYLFYSYRARQDIKRNAIFAKLPKDDRLIFSITGDCPYILLYALPA